jgi:hypothetical protein
MAVIQLGHGIGVAVPGALNQSLFVGMIIGWH